MAKKKYPSNQLHPRYWPTWLAIGGLHLGAWLPWRAKVALGRGIGLAALLFAKERRHITQVNLRLAFPELNKKEQRRLLRSTFQANGIGMLEVATCLVRRVDFLKNRVQVKGREHMARALAEGRGALVVGAHFSMLDLGGALHALFFPGDTLYKANKNPVFNEFIRKGREQYLDCQVEQKDLKGLVRRIRQGHAVWYSPDQDFGRKISVFAPFFGVEAASITMTARIARMTAAPVIPLRMHRNPDNYTYSLEYLPPLENFPSGDEVADATRINRILEQMIRVHPEQYLWMHRRFKTRPDPEDPGYY